MYGSGAHILKLFSPSGRPTILVFRIKRYCNVRMATPLTGARMQARY